MKWNIFFKAFAKEPKKVVAMWTHPFFQVPTLEFGNCAGARVQLRTSSGYKLGTGKKIVTWHFFTHGAFRSSQEVVETCPCVPDRNGIWKCLFLRRGKTEIHREKPLGVRTRTNNKLNPHTCMGSTPGLEPGPYWWEASVLTTAPLSIFVSSGAVHCFVPAAKLKFQTGHWPS